ncbi:hypothetical protein [Aquimarina sp. MMG016]|uniref:hypothetical protein n=1 Tax=Aquimarina sp. MMG016 TaxID=2822690 RepID=UPI001B3A2C79|nr:hypothetical protein [Aquimarina sp. MMG016]MBQ4822324.1 hypothetical protein [Aquimarina sp. MMG016]
MKKILCQILLITLASCVNEQFDLFDNIEKIDVNSKLYNDLQSIAEDSETVCLTFIYPFNIYLYNENGEIAESKIVSNNIEFIELLGRMPNENAIGLSYPISGTTEKGTTITINNNFQLKEAIEGCIESQIITNCNNILEENCIWKINSLTENDRYNESLFDFYPNGTGIFYDQGNAYRTSWIALFIEKELHINIHLEDDSEAPQNWNFDWKANIVDENSIELLQNDQKYLIRKECNIVNSCDYVEFKECELEGSENIAEFIFDNYTDCITSFRQDMDPNELELSFHKTILDAEQDTHRLDTSAYTNTFNPQIIFVRIKNWTSETFEIIRIVLVAESCNQTE